MRPRALGLIRVSKEREGLVSPDIQRSAIDDMCRSRRYELVGMLEGIDQSGSQESSAWWPTLDRAVGFVESGEVDVLAVWKFSRAARDRLKWAIALAQVERAGGRLESATEQFDTGTSSGRLARGMLAEINAFEAERIGEVWRDVHKRRISGGLTHNGRRRFGYSYADGLHTPDLDTGPVVAELYARFIAGASVYKLSQELNARGLRTTAGGLWTDRTLRRYLDSGFPAGFVPYDGELHTGAHAPLIDAETWAAYLAAKGARSRVAPRSKGSPYLLSGLVRCGHCKGAMTGGTFGKNRTPKYRCERRRATGAAGCAAGYVSMRHVHERLFEDLRTIAHELDSAASSAAHAARAAHTDRSSDADRLAAEVARLTKALARLAQQHAEDEDSDPEVYRAARDDYRQRLEAARKAHREATLERDQHEAVPAAVVLPLVEDWETLAVEARRAMLRRVYRFVEVTTRDRGTPADVRCVPLWVRD